MIAVLPAACARKPATVTVYAAASLDESLKAVATAYEAKTGTKVTLSFGASSTLARQIEQGAPADIFFSADTDWMDYLQQKALIDTSSRQNVLANHLVIIAQPGTPALAVESHFAFAKALGNGRLSVADPATVPAGRYAKASLEKLGIWDAVAAHVVPAENTRVALEYVVQGEAPYGIVYETDAKVAPTVKVVGTFPDDSHPPIVYPIALMRSASPAARDFLDFVKGPQARAIFLKAGFNQL
jgi:molybdate transport system substrate-binding protein